MLQAFDDDCLDDLGNLAITSSCLSTEHKQISINYEATFVNGRTWSTEDHLNKIPNE